MRIVRDMKHKCTDTFHKAFYDISTTRKHSNHVLILMREFEKRMEKNSRYSLRAFARDLDLNLGHLSRVFRGERVPRRKTAVSICERLGLSQEDKVLFMESVIARQEKEVLAVSVNEIPVS